MSCVANSKASKQFIIIAVEKLKGANNYEYHSHIEDIK